MARKVCPACKKLNAGSATACSCGHAFEATSIVAPRRAQRCPRCGRVRLETEERCACDLEPDANIEEVRDELRGQVQSGWATAVLGLLAVSLGIGSLFAELPLIWLGGMVGGSAMSIRGFRAQHRARARLRELEAFRLPAAKVVREP